MVERIRDDDSREPRRQVINYTFYKIAPEWRRLEVNQKGAQRREFGEVLARWTESEQMKVLAYSLVGMRADCDMMLWRICYSLECLQEMQAELMSTELGSYLSTPYAYLGMTKRSQYQIGHEGMRQGTLRCGGYKYLSLHPFVKTRAWYQLPFEQRQDIVSEYVRITEESPDVRVNVTYSFGLDDQEFVITCESNQPAEFVDLMMRLRESENAMFTLRDTPVFTCLHCSPDEMLERLG